MNEKWPATASQLAARVSKLFRQLNENLEEAEMEMARRSVILQRASHGAPFAAAFDRYMRSVGARENAAAELRRNHFHVQG